MKSIVILISGRGSNMQALLEAQLPCRIAAVISNRADAAGLQIARQHNAIRGIELHDRCHGKSVARLWRGCKP